MYGLDFTMLRFGVFYNLVNLVDVIKGCSATVFEGFAQQKMKLRLIFLSQIGCPFMVTIQCFFISQWQPTRRKRKSCKTIWKMWLIHSINMH